MITKEGGARITVRWFSRGSLADRVRWRTQSGYRRVAWLGSAQPCTRGSGESSTRNRTRVPTSSRFPLPPRGRVHAPACKPALRVHRAADRNPTDVQHVYVSPGNINIAIYARFNWPAAPRPALGPRSPRPPPAGPLNTTANLPTRFDVQVHSPQEGRAPSRRPHGLFPLCIRNQLSSKNGTLFIFSSICSLLVVFRVPRPADRLADPPAEMKFGRNQRGREDDSPEMERRSSRTSVCFARMIEMAKPHLAYVRPSLEA